MRQTASEQVNTVTEQEAYAMVEMMSHDDLTAEIARVQGEIEDHRREIDGKTAWMKACQQALTAEHDGCFFLDGLSRDELLARLATARGEMDEAAAVIAGCEARLLIVA